MHGALAAEVIIQRNLRDIGIKLDIQNYDVATFFGPFLPGGRRHRPREPWRAGMTSPSLRTALAMTPTIPSCSACDQIPPNGSGNLNFYCNHALDALYTQEQATADPGVRQQIFQQIHQIYLTDLPFIVLYGAPYFSYRAQGDAQLPAQPLPGRNHQHLGVVVR